MQQAYDYIAEASDLADVLSNRTDQIFNLETQFKSWTINDIIGHSYMFDLAALKALERPKKICSNRKWNGQWTIIARVPI